MKFNLEISAGNYHIVAYAAGQITLLLPLAETAEVLPAAPETLTGSLVVMPQQLLRQWPPRGFDDLSVDHFDQVATMQPELVLFGSGARLRFPSPALTRGLINRGIGVEVMDTGAACRTYNILMGEGRNVAAALLMI